MKRRRSRPAARSRHANTRRSIASGRLRTLPKDGIESNAQLVEPFVCTSRTFPWLSLRATEQLERWRTRSATLVIPVLELMPREDLARVVKISARSIQALRNGHGRPSKEHRVALIRAAGDYARQQTGLDIETICAPAQHF